MSLVCNKMGQDGNQRIEKYLIELLSENNIVSRGVIEFGESLENAEELGRRFLLKLLESATYSSYVNNTLECISPRFAVADLGSKENLKYLCISFGKEFQSGKGKCRTVKEVLTKCLTYSVPAYVPTVLLMLCIATYKPMPDEVCFAQIGCLSLGAPWTERPLVFNFVPQSPSAINTSFIITSREYPEGYQFSAMTNDPDISGVDWKKNLNIIIHGFTDNATESWVSRLAHRHVQQEDINILSVDWSTGADMYYPQSVANARVVAAQIVLFLEYLTGTRQETLGEIHIIGHSLGAHIAGYVGKRTRNIKRITGLDPAAPLFDGFHKDVGLHMTDAEEVIVYHTNAAPVGFGIRDPMGTVDIYVNDGQDQSGCIPMLDLLLSPPTIERIQGMRENIACSHRRAYEIFSEAILSKHPLVAYPCHQYGTPDSELCVSFCETKEKCHRVTKDAIDVNGHKIFYLPTTDRYPYCVTHAKISAVMCDTQYPVFKATINGGFYPFLKPIFEGVLLANHRLESLAKVQCSLLYEPSLSLQLEVATADSLLYPPEACFSSLEVSYIDNNDEIITLSVENVKVTGGQCSNINFSNGKFSLLSYSDSFLEYLHRMKMNVVIPFYKSLEIDNLLRLYS